MLLMEAPVIIGFNKSRFYSALWVDKRLYYLHASVASFPTLVLNGLQRKWVVHIDLMQM